MHDYRPGHGGEIFSLQNDRAWFFVATSLMLVAMLLLLARPAAAKGDTAQASPATSATAAQDGPGIQKGSLAYGETVVTRSWGGVGTAQGWTYDNGSLAYGLPFSFPFFGKSYTQIYISTNGMITFSQDAGMNNSNAGLIARKCIAPMWDDLDLRNGSGVTGSDIYILRASTYVIIRWQGKVYPYSGATSAVNFECMLFSNGAIRFNYGTGNSPITATVGISKGDGYNYILSYHNARSNCNQVQSVQYVPVNTTYAVFGYTVANIGNLPIPGVTVAYTGETSVSSSATGYFGKMLQIGWSGTITPTKAGYSFVPASRQVTHLAANTIGNFIGYPTGSTVVLSGTASLNSAGLSGVTVILTGASGHTNYQATTNASGAWSATVPSGWTGTIGASLAGYSFTPSTYNSQTYSSTWSGIDFTAVQDAGHYVHGTAYDNTVTGISGTTIALTGAAGQPSYAVTTNANGVFAKQVPTGWSGTVSPSKTGYTFNPTSRTVTNVTAAVGNQNFMGYEAGDTITISGQALFNSAGLTGVNIGLVGSGGSGTYSTTTGAGGLWSVNVPVGWAGVITPSQSGYTFSPSSLTLTARYLNHTCADFVATQVQTTSTEPLVIIMVGFTNFANQGAEAEWAAKNFGTSGLTLRNYYLEASRNGFYFAPVVETSGTANNGVIRVTLNRVHPDPESNSSTADQKYQELARDAIVAADPYINYAAYDANSDGWISSRELHLAIYVAGYETSYDSNTPSVWAHMWSLMVGDGYLDALPRPDGVYVGCYNSTASRDGGYTMQGQNHGSHAAPFGTVAHELGHDIGLPDLYDVNSNTAEGVGIHCLMSSGSWGYATGEYPGARPVHLSAWCKLYLGFVSSINIGQSGSWSGSLLATNSISYAPLKISTSDANQYFLVEFRKPVGYDAGLQCLFGSTTTGGLAIWHIDMAKRTTNNQDNGDWTHKLVDLEVPGYNSATGDPLDLGYTRGSLSHYWRTGTSYSHFYSSSTPNTNLYNGTVTGISVTATGDGTASTMPVTVP